MRLFSRKDRGSSRRSDRQASERPGWMQDGAQAALLEGGEDLDVVGERHYQQNLWRITGTRPGDWVRLEIIAVLVAEDGNPHDAHAIAVWVNGLKVGYLAREIAHSYRAGLLAKQKSSGMPIALRGIVSGGGMDHDRPGNLGVFLHHSPQDFGIPATPARPGASSEPAGPSEPTGYDASLPDDRIPAFPAADLDDARQTYLTNYNHRSMNSGRGSAEITALVGTSRFQDALRQAAITPRPWRHEADRHLPAILVPQPRNPATVAVLIDGAIVGYLSSDTARQHRDQLQELAASSQYLVCSALIVGGQEGKSYGVRLQVKPDIGRRWAAGAKPES